MYIHNVPVFVHTYVSFVYLIQLTQPLPPLPIPRESGPVGMFFFYCLENHLICAYVHISLVHM